MPHTMTDAEALAIDVAHSALSRLVYRYEELAWALPGPVPTWVHLEYREALNDALGVVRTLAGHPNAARVCSAQFLEYAGGLAELERDSLDYFPRTVAPDEARHVPDWEELDRWLIGGSA